MAVDQRDSVSLDSEHPSFAYAQGRIALPPAVGQGSTVLFGIPLLDELSFPMASGDTIKAAGLMSGLRRHRKGKSRGGGDALGQGADIGRAPGNQGEVGR